MSDARFTPGPWYPGHFGTDSSCQCRSIVSDGEYAGAIATVHTDNGKPICDGGNDAPGRDEAIANMHLISASPELFEALEGLLNRYVGLVESGDAGFWDAEQEECVIKARASLAKASPSTHDMGVVSHG